MEDSSNDKIIETNLISQFTCHEFIIINTNVTLSSEDVTMALETITMRTRDFIVFIVLIVKLVFII